MRKVNIGELKSVVRNVYSLAESGKHVALMVWGPPGVGKSAGIRQVCEELQIGMIDLRLSLLNPVDLRGLPSVDKEAKKAEWYEPEFLPNGKHTERGILFLDEINLAPQAVMSAGYQLILDRAIGNYKMPKGWITVAAGNRTEDGVAVTKFPPPLANRFIHVEIAEPDIEEWKNWAIQNNIRQEIVAFLSKMPQHLYKQGKVGEKAWPSPRSWHFASNLMDIGEHVESAVGTAVATEFMAFLSVYKEMPDVELIAAGEEQPVPTKPDVLWALTTALIYRADNKNLENILKYNMEVAKEFQVRVFSGIAKKSDAMRKDLSLSPTWKKWYEANKEFVNADI